jgi:medium-chain acyl-[acyl-carrier-protein] hydrolase
MNASKSSWFSPPAADMNPRVRLLCCPCAGGGPSSYALWRRDLKPWGIEVRALQLPGREGRMAERPLTDHQSIVEMASDEAARLLDVPYVVFGHSMGALIAFELVRRLRARGLPLPVCLMVAGAGAPHRTQYERPLHQIADDSRFVDAVQHEYGGIPAEVLAHKELLKLLVPALRADLRVVETYAYVEGPPLPVSIAAYGGTRDATVTADDLQAWGTHTTAPFSSRMFEGDHFFVHAVRAALQEELRSRVAHLLAV